jgi:hypothetical protein
MGMIDFTPPDQINWFENTPFETLIKCQLCGMYLYHTITKARLECLNKKCDGYKRLLPVFIPHPK